jgi:hypothetical protein
MTGVIVVAFLIAAGIYYFFSVNQIPQALDTGRGTTIGQGAGQR